MWPIKRQARRMEGGMYAQREIKKDMNIWTRHVRFTRSVLARKVVSVNNTNHNTNKKTYSNKIKNKPKMAPRWPQEAPRWPQICIHRATAKTKNRKIYIYILSGPETVIGLFPFVHELSQPARPFRHVPAGVRAGGVGYSGFRKDGPARSWPGPDAECPKTAPIPFSEAPDKTPGFWDTPISAHVVPDPVSRLF